MLREQIETIIKEQHNKVTTIMGKQYFPVDIILANGNILLRAFRIIDLAGDKITGITWKEEYSAPRERREPVYSYFDLDEIASLRCEDLEVEFVRETSKL